MGTEAAHVVDRVLPNVPVRQWVLSLPWELRAAAAMKPGVIGAMDRIFAQEIARLTRRLASSASPIGAASRSAPTPGAGTQISFRDADRMKERTGRSRPAAARSTPGAERWTSISGSRSGHGSSPAHAAPR
jgi:hypothetical protein